MKSDVILIDGGEESRVRALQQAEAVSAFYGLPQKKALHLRLLTEETIGLILALTGEVTARFWIESEEDAFRLHLAVRTQMDADKRSELLAVSTSGKNAAAKGVTGKLRDLLERALNAAYAPADPNEDEISWLEGIGSAAQVGFGRSAAYASWSMRAYKEAAQRMAEEEHDPAAEEAWDELEKSIVGRLADDVSIGIRGSDVEMIITMLR